MELQLQRQKAEGPEVKKPNLTGIPTQMKLNFERRSGLSFDDVRVHYNSDKPARLGALAYTQGTQIHVGPGQERSLPHELGHVIQQKAGRVRPTRWIGGLPVNDQPELEREADLAPVQCMPAPALWGVVQMDLAEMPHQRGANCGYHALARALLNFQETGTAKLPYDKDNLELYLTSYAIQTGFSVIGEAFDPYALAHVGNQFCQNSGIPVICVIRTYDSEEKLEDILSTPDSVILLPYFPDLGTMNVSENKSTPPEENAHWSAIDTDSAGSHKLYEGNFHGSTGYVGAAGPADVVPHELFGSNQSIHHQFSWSQFIRSRGISGMNRLKGNILGAGCDFADSDAVQNAVHAVVKNINSIRGCYAKPPLLFEPNSITQGVSLKGFAVEVKKQ